MTAPSKGRAGGNQADALAFAAAGLDRAAHLRRDDAPWRMVAAKERVATLWRGKVLCDDTGRPLWRGPEDAPLNEGPQVFLGLRDGAAWLARDVSGWEPPPEDDAVIPGFNDPSIQRHRDMADGAGFRELRSILGSLTPEDGELLATAKAILGWHATHGFCARCGSPTAIERAGWLRRCGACAAEHFPRTDPVVIMLVEDGNRLLLGRSPGWPEAMYSLLAGFIDPGETLEAAVRREVFEETGVRVGQVSFLTSQPWPFPSSLMLGCRAEALSQTITLDPVELEDALWITREDAVEVMLGRHPGIRPPRPGAIAAHLIARWLSGRLDRFPT